MWLFHYETWPPTNRNLGLARGAPDPGCLRRGRSCPPRCANRQVRRAFSHRVAHLGSDGRGPRGFGARPTRSRESRRVAAQFQPRRARPSSGCRRNRRLRRGRDTLGRGLDEASHVCAAEQISQLLMARWARFVGAQRREVEVVRHSCILEMGARRQPRLDVAQLGPALGTESSRHLPDARRLRQPRTRSVHQLFTR